MGIGQLNANVNTKLLNDLNGGDVPSGRRAKIRTAFRVASGNFLEMYYPSMFNYP